MGSNHDLGAGLLEFAKKAFVLDLVEVSLGGEDADDTRCEVTDECRATCCVGEFSVGQPSEESRGIDWLAVFPHLGDATKDDLVGGMKEVFFPHALFPGEVDDMFGIGQHGAEEGAFGLKIVMGK